MKQKKKMYYTSIEQSNKLLGLGLNPETADMYYSFGRLDVINIKLTEEHWKQMIGADIIPAWSFGALLDIMPKEIVDEDDIEYRLIIDVEDDFPKYYNLAYEIYHNKFPYPIRAEDKSLFEYIVEGVIWLLENKFIKRKED